MTARLTAALLALAIASSAGAQATRHFQADALRGELTVTQPPQVQLGEGVERLAPGVRIHDEFNRLVPATWLVGRTATVHYTRDAFGLLGEVWVLTPEERAREPWPTTREQAQRWLFDWSSQSWQQR